MRLTESFFLSFNECFFKKILRIPNTVADLMMLLNFQIHIWQKKNLSCHFKSFKYFLRVENILTSFPDKNLHNSTIEKKLEQKFLCFITKKQLHLRLSIFALKNAINLAKEVKIMLISCVTENDVANKSLLNR